MACHCQSSGLINQLGQVLVGELRHEGSIVAGIKLQEVILESQQLTFREIFPSHYLVMSLPDPVPMKIRYLTKTQPPIQNVG
jgi:hypothetical protein